MGIRRNGLNGIAGLVHAQLTPAAYTLPMPARGGIHFVVARAGGRTTRHRVTIL